MRSPRLDHCLAVSMNERPHTHETRRIARSAAIVAGCTAWLLLTLWISIRFGLNSPPAPSGDEPSYDAIAWQLSHGNGFREDFHDAQFQKPYLRVSTADEAKKFFDSTTPGTVTYRPPLFPSLIALTNIAADRQFWLVRIINITFISIAVGLTVFIASREAGFAGASAAFGTMVLLDVRTRLFARTILTEPLSLCLVTLLTVLLLTRRSAAPKSSIWFLSSIGLCLGLMLWTRSSFALWLPGVLLFAPILLPRTESSDIAVHSRGIWIRYRSMFIALSLAVIIFLPWMVRNCMVLQHIMPLGTQGLMELPAGFSDEAVQRGGVWFHLSSTGFFQKVDKPEMSTLERELARADFSASEAERWIKNHPHQAIKLGFMKVWNEYRPRSMPETILSLLSVAGLMLTIRRPATHVMITLHCVSALAIAATWSVEGRFLVPLMLSQHVWAASAVTALQRCWIGHPGPKEIM
ncbi:MAG: hypothetical protein JNM43_18995 [Planctomycetaceae bacterium]|nr:hypothetical protein [Planctomycetaceae bacterium]